MGDFENKANEWKGEVKENVGDATDNEDLEAEGAFDQAKAKAKQTVENAKDGLEDAGHTAKDKVKDAFDR
ncbi:MAG TPA: CsbD family protein [Aeromicrobium sp.]|nr:CsbD family protein [Aeromicrobium sp.]